MKNLVKVLSPAQMRQADAFTIANEPISSLDLMERAAANCVVWISKHYELQQPFSVFCGLGNNGGDGLAIARLMLNMHYQVKTYIVRHSGKSSIDFETNEKRLKRIARAEIMYVDDVADIPVVQSTVIIDALLGTGLNKPAEGLLSACIRAMNNSGAEIIAIDMPSGLFADRHTAQDLPVINARHTLSFQCPKIAFMFPENARRVGEWVLLNIGIDPVFMESLEHHVFYLTATYIKTLLKTREKFSHKGSYGHALLIAGHYGSMGAAVLAARACLRSGVGLLTVHVPEQGVDILQISVPEAMVSVDTHETIFSLAPDVERFDAIGIGPGIGTEEPTQKALYKLMQQQSIVLDADALNIISLNKYFCANIPARSILTPHPKEFERLTEKASNDFERFDMQMEFSRKHNVYVLLKGAHSCLTTPKGEVFFNSTGNPGMAKGGSGDILTGIITGLLAQGYNQLEASLIGMFIHGRAGDIAAEKLGQTGMVAGDIVDCLPEAFLRLEKTDI
jgi:hydroxyethylthiazole kinase-like uncharacterized protein yjeF